MDMRLELLNDYYFDVWYESPDKYKGKTEEELEEMILSQINNRGKDNENLVIFAYLLLISKKGYRWYENHEQFGRLSRFLDYYIEEGYTNYWEYKDYEAYAI